MSRIAWLQPPERAAAHTHALSGGAPRASAAAEDPAAADDPAAPQSARRASGQRPRFSWALRWGAPLAVVAIAAIAVLVARPSASLAAGVAVLLAAVAASIGWLLGEERRAELRNEIERRTSELTHALSDLEIAQAETVRRLSMAVEFRDEDTGAHIERIGRFSSLLAEQLGADPELVERISHAAPLHDVGKVAIPDAILLKPGPLTPQERAIVETHAEEGHRLLRGSSSSILDLAASIALSHHERWDGGGYPRGLIGEEIPLEGRIVAIADVFDALTSDRVYRKAFPMQEAVSMMVAQRGKHFDPRLLDAFLEVLGSTGPEARRRLGGDPQSLAAQVFQSYSAAIERGDAETAEGVIAQAIEDGLSAAVLHEQVMGAAMRRVGELWERGEIDLDGESLATGITRRILATMHRYMLGGAEPTRERVLVAGVAEDEHTLALQMAHDQIAAAGYRATLDTEVTVERVDTLLQSHSPQLVVLGATTKAVEEEVRDIVRALRSSRASVRVMVGGAGIPAELRHDAQVRCVERVAEVVPAAEEMLAARDGALS